MMKGNREVEIFRRKLEEIKINPNGAWALYGTGNGAELIYTVLCCMSLDTAIKTVIDRNEAVGTKKGFHGISIKKLSDVCDTLEGIIIAAFDNHEMIKNRIYNSLTETQLNHIRVIDIFAYNTKEEKIEYAEYIEKSILKRSESFIDFNNQGYQAKENDTKVIAWYLPQFHQMEINNRFHGQGFTEWTNTSKAVPLYTGHYQPHIPYDVGYYDLLNPDTFKRQIYLAKHYGIFGFCMHYYWFSGKKIMEKPLELFLQHKELDMPFCLDWATENWTALWDGGNREIMLEQNLKADDDRKFMEDILPYMLDPRYIKINGKPVLVIYRINTFQKKRVKELLCNFRKTAKEKGFPDLYIMVTNAFGFQENATEWGADALVEFPPHMMLELMDRTWPSGYLNPYFDGQIWNACSFIKQRRYMLKHTGQTYFRSALVSWDNTARKATSKGTIVQDLNPQTFKKWLTDIVIESKQIHSKEEDIVFINSWNEWAEGDHLEPDMKYGYAYLQTVKEVLEKLNN